MFYQVFDPGVKPPIDLNQLFTPVLGAWIGSLAVREREREKHTLQEVQDVKSDVERLKNVARNEHPADAEAEGLDGIIENTHHEGGHHEAP